MEQDEETWKKVESAGAENEAEKMCYTCEWEENSLCYVCRTARVDVTRRTRAKAAGGAIAKAKK